MEPLPPSSKMRKLKGIVLATMAVRRFSTTSWQCEEPRHQKSRAQHPQYPKRTLVPDHLVDWAVKWDYRPVKFEHGAVIANDRTVKPGGWADPANHRDVDFLASGKCRSYACAKRRGAKKSSRGLVDLDTTTGLPLNPEGRTGMIGRGLLGKWGPNHAADPIVTRFALVQTPEGGCRKVLQMVAIRRKDTGEWAIPGGMVDDGETVSATLRREFKEEAGNIAETGSPAQVLKFEQLIEQLFCPDNARPVYQGYVDDPRNTDNAWMETSAVHYHCSDELGAMLQLCAGDDADAVRWLTVDADDPVFSSLYASHMSMVLQAKQQMQMEARYLGSRAHDPTSLLAAAVAPATGGAA